jgi:hypothetical protein
VHFSPSCISRTRPAAARRALEGTHPRFTQVPPTSPPVKMAVLRPCGPIHIGQIRPGPLIGDRVMHVKRAERLDFGPRGLQRRFGTAVRRQRISRLEAAAKVCHLGADRSTTQSQQSSTSANHRPGRSPHDLGSVSGSQALRVPPAAQRRRAVNDEHLSHSRCLPDPASPRICSTSVTKILR